MRKFALLFLALTACDAPPPQLEDRISPAARAADFPPLLPLGPVFSDIEALLPQDQDRAALSLDARSADLRRRAAELQALDVN